MITVEVAVEVDPALLRPPQPFAPFLARAMETATERVRVAGEANVACSIVRPTGRPRKKNAPGYGPLAGSLTKTVTSQPGKGATGHVRSDVYYGRFLEFGTAGHRIAVRRRLGGPRALAFGGPGGTLLFRRAVVHPGQRGLFWMRRAAVDQTPGVVSLFEQETRQWTRAIFGGGTM